MSASHINMEATKSTKDIIHAEASIPVNNVEYRKDSQTDRSTADMNPPSDSDSSDSEDQNTNNETIEDSESDTSDQSNSRTSRELKLLLALSKEANLDTNISYKRKTSDITKTKDAKDVANKSGSTELELLLKRPFKSISSEMKVQKFPVTAEAELEAAMKNDIVKTTSDKNNMDTMKRKTDSLSEVIEGASDSSKKSRLSTCDISSLKMGKDRFCWRCHRDGINVSCETCSRSYHYKCLKQSIPDSDHWACPECVSILKAESMQTRSEAMKNMTLEHLCGLLKFALKRMLRCQESHPFINPVSEVDYPDYKKYIVQPMYLSLLEKNIKENFYGSTQAFEADAKWILHNSIIFNSYQSKLTSVAKSMIKVCKQEMSEIENCPSCYLNANTKKDTWFVEVCPKPHILVWAKLKGFPYWPAKAMCTNHAGMVDVRFFGAHDRAWVPYKECYLYCRRDPNSHKQKKNDINECIKELEVYIDNLRKMYGEFHYAPFKMPFDPNNELKQIQLFLPRYRPDFKPKGSRSKVSRKSIEAIPVVSAGSPEQETTQQNGSVDNNVSEGIKSGSPKIEEDMDVDVMEGYGTDDETVNPQIDDDVRRYRRRSSYASENDDADDKIESEAEEESDAQVNNSLTFDTSPMRGKVRTRGGLNASPGKLKFIPRLINMNDESSSPQKRTSPNDSPPDTPPKLSRRNSDQSVKSDSSRLSNISDKINKVDLSENMEFTVGNAEDGSINIGGSGLVGLEKVTSEKSKSSETILKKEFEAARKPIQNNESPLPPQKPMKITEKLIKRLSESLEGSNNEKNKNESPNPKKTTVILSEKPQSPEKIQEVKGNPIMNVTENEKSVLEDTALSRNTISTNSVASSHSVDTNKENATVTTPSDKPANEETKESSLMTETTKSTQAASSTSATKPLSVDEDPQADIEDPQVEIEDPPANIEDTTMQIDNEEQETKEANLTTASNDSNHLETDQTELKTPEVRPNGDVNNQVDVIEHLGDSDENSLEYSQIDSVNIRNIIHSSLNESSNVTRVSSIEPQEELGESVHKKRKLSDTDEDDSNNVQTSKTVKLTLTGNATLSDKTTVKSVSQSTSAPVVIKSPVIPSEHVPKDNNPQNTSTPEQVLTVITKSVTATTPVNNINDENIDIIEIKSEPESDTESQDKDNEYMEAKRKYMSALNISERQDETAKPKSPEIRTRSKTEEIRCRPLDNLSRTIDDVATNFSSNNVGKAGPPKNNDHGKSGRFEEQQIYVKPLSQMQEPQKQKVIRKPISKPTCVIPPPQRISPHTPHRVATILPKPLKNDNTHLLKKAVIAQSIVQEKNKTSVDPLSTSSNLVVLQTQPCITSIASLPPNQTIVYTPNTQSPIISVSQPSSVSSSVAPKTVSQPVKKKPVNFNTSQNYIPQNEIRIEVSSPSSLETPMEIATSPTSLIGNLLNNPIVSSANQTSSTTTSSNEDHESTIPATCEEFSEFTVLNGLLPDNTCKELSNVLCRPMPKLKPRPPGPLSKTFEEPTPSSAGPVTTKINSISHRLNDYFRGMLVELLEDLGNSDNKESTIALLKAEIESLKHSHALEIAEIRKNISATLKDVQKSIIEDREKIRDETRASCEAEAVKRIEEAKSKQWCANCTKEAQFYCCWNTSYCDYPCQQKHWAKHMSKCTQHSNSQNQQPHQPRVRPGPYVIRHPHPNSTPKEGSRLVAKPTKVYVNRGLSASKNISHYKAATGNQVTLVESTPGNFELQGLGGPIALSRKIVAALGNVKSASVVTSSPSTSTAGTSLLPRVTSITHTKGQSLGPTRNISVSDDSD